MDNVGKLLQSAQRDIQVDPLSLQNIKHLLQWVANLALNLMASIPDFKSGRKGPGVRRQDSFRDYMYCTCHLRVTLIYPSMVLCSSLSLFQYDLCHDVDALNVVRQLLLLIRLWSVQRDGFVPTFTKMADSVDVLASLFSLVTRQASLLASSSSEEASSQLGIQEDCLRLPSQVLIPAINSVQIRSRGAAPAIVAAAAATASALSASTSHSGRQSQPHVNFYFGEEPHMETAGGGGTATFVEGVVSNAQIVDCVRQMYLGKDPHDIKQCTRLVKENIAGCCDM